MIIIRDAPGYMYSFLVNVHCPVSGWIPGMAAEYPVGKSMNKGPIDELES